MAQKMRPQAETLSGSPQPNFTGYAVSPILSRRNPATSDTGYALGQIWINKLLNNAYVLTSVSAGSATWVAAGGGTIDLSTLTADSGGAISPSSGNITLAGGTGMSTSGSGSTVTFNITNFSAVAAWTPNVQINGSSTGITYTTQAGAWYRIGNAVHISGNIVLNSIGASTGSVTISNLPVATGAAGANNTMPVFASLVTNTANYTNVQLNFGTSSAVGTFFESGSAQTTQVVTNARITSGSVLQFSGVYFVN